jgi:molecular chaperone Hsp33
MKDYLYKGRFEGLDVAFTYVVATEAVNEAVVRHDCDPVAAHLLGRAMAGTLLGAAVQSDGNRLNAYWRYQGALQTLVVDAGQDGSVRGFIHPTSLSHAEGAGEALYGDTGQLQLVVTREGQIIHSGTTPVPFQDVISDLAYFYCISDQVETGMNVMIGFRADPEKPVALCQGWMLQALPGADLERFSRIRARMDGEAFRSLMAQGSEADGYFESIAKTLVGEESDFKGIELSEAPAPRFHCPCSKERMGAVVKSISVNDRMAMVKEGEDVAISCQFCGARYVLTIPECINVWNNRPMDAAADDH